MSDIPFHKTPMGRKFFDQDFPELVKQLKRIADVLDTLEEVKEDD